MVAMPMCGGGEIAPVEPTSNYDAPVLDMAWCSDCGYFAVEAGCRHQVLCSECGHDFADRRADGAPVLCAGCSRGVEALAADAWAAREWEKLAAEADAAHDLDVADAMDAERCGAREGDDVDEESWMDDEDCGAEAAE